MSCRGTGKVGSSTRRVCSTSQGSSPETSETRTSHGRREASAELHCSRGLDYGQTHRSSLGCERRTAKWSARGGQRSGVREADSEGSCGPAARRTGARTAKRCARGGQRSGVRESVSPCIVTARRQRGATPQDDCERGQLAAREGREGS